MNTSKATSLAIVLAASGLVAYAVYFDYKRRNDAAFRRKLRKEKKKADKNMAASQQAAETAASLAPSIDPDTLRQALEQVRKEDPPKTAEEREQYFMSQVAMGEQLAAQGPEFHLPAALSFYRALRMYPAPVELIVIYQKTVPPPIFAIVMEMTNLDVKSRAEGYYDQFPPTSMNVSVGTKQMVDAKGNSFARKCLIAEKDFSAGDVIYTEQSVVAALDADLEGKGTHCSYCLRQIEPGCVIGTESDRIPAVYCSTDCQRNAKAQYGNLLYTLDPVLSPEIVPATSSPAMNNEARKQAQEEYLAYLKRVEKASPLLVAKFIGRQVEVEMTKMIPGANKNADTIVGGDEYSLYDHIERLRYLEVVPPDEEPQLLSQVLKHALPGLEQFITEDRHAMLLGKMMYNSFGVCLGTGRDDKPTSSQRPEDVEKTRTPHGTSRQHGTAFFTVSSYLGHSCTPNTLPTFASGTSELSLVACSDIKKGDELTVAYVDVTVHDGETVIEARRRRRIDLARGWRFACTCQRCTSEVEEGASADAAEDGVGSLQEGSKVEEVVDRFDARQPGGLI